MEWLPYDLQRNYPVCLRMRAWKCHDVRFFGFFVLGATKDNDKIKTSKGFNVFCIGKTGCIWKGAKFYFEVV